MNVIDKVLRRKYRRIINISTTIRTVSEREGRGGGGVTPMSISLNYLAFV